MLWCKNSIRDLAAMCRRWLAPGLAPILLILAACSDQGVQTKASSSAQFAQGQVVAPEEKQVSYYAAARFLEQASFGPTPESIERVRQLGFSAWIDEQLAMPYALLDGTELREMYKLAPMEIGLTRAQTNQYFDFFEERFFEQILTSQAQLRLRTAWSLSQFVTVACCSAVQPYAIVQYANLLTSSAFGNYRQLLKDVTVSPPMGKFLDNEKNRPVSADCQGCAPNENYARELMQLFSLGVTLLNADGSVVRDTKGKPMISYTQEDVENLARALTGWRFDGSWWTQPWTDSFNNASPMIPDPNENFHDSGSKVIFGKSIAAGGDARQDLEALLDILMQHQNVAPFVALRMIQHLVTSDPSGAYISRIAAVFNDNGSGVQGDMAAVVKAILLDSEARRGDLPGSLDRRVGKVREPLLTHSAVLRGMGCVRLPRSNWDETRPAGSHPQRPFHAQNVFSFYLPTDRAPASGLLAPEQRLLTTDDIGSRLWKIRSFMPDDGDPFRRLDAAGCNFREFVEAYERSPRELSSLTSSRFMRGAMPPTLRDTIETLAQDRSWDDQARQAATAVSFAIASPTFGVIR